MGGIFFSKNKRTALVRIRKIERREGIKLTKPVLAKKQIRHIAGWKTFKSRIKK